MKYKIEYKYLHDTDISNETYLIFLRKFYKERAEFRLFKRYSWYNKYLDFHCLLAIIDGNIIGQSCAFKVRVMTPDGEKEWWWGCDSFVLEESRGLGVGKGLQKKLLQDHPNFSSVGYSRTNGHIKKKLGSDAITRTYPSFYPISSWLSVWLNMALKKVVGKCFKKPHWIPYVPLYKWANSRKLQDFTANETVWSEENINFINETLSRQNDLYVIRDERYLRWKYDENPSVDYHLLEIRKNMEIVAVLLFSIAYDGNFMGCPLRLCKLYDLFVHEDSGLLPKDAITLIADYYASKNEPIEGIRGILSINYKATIQYPKEGKDLLSIYKGYFKHPYFSCSDQDLDQLHFLEE